MRRSKESLDALEGMLKERFPDSEGHQDLVYKDFKRPAFLVEVGKQTMEDATRWAVDRTAQCRVTLFEAIDVRHNSQVEALSDKLSLAMELLSCAAIQVGDRFLDVSGLSGEYFNDYAEVAFTLSWQDDRETGPVEGALAQHYDLTVEVNKEV